MQRRDSRFGPHARVLTRDCARVAHSYSGDYFLPGSPLEGWSVEWRVGSASAGVNRKINKGLAYGTDITPSTVDGA